MLKLQGCKYFDNILNCLSKIVAHDRLSQ